jgi:hypothetical protein
MSDTDLSRAVEAFAARVIDIPDAALERDWPWRSKKRDRRTNRRAHPRAAECGGS